MTQLVHEIWIYREDGMDLSACVLAGPDGDTGRALNPADARLLCTFEAGSHFEAMTLYNAKLGTGPYTTDQAWDYEPYPAEWLQRQRAAGIGQPIP